MASPYRFYVSRYVVIGEFSNLPPLILIRRSKVQEKPRQHRINGANYDPSNDDAVFIGLVSSTE